MKKYELLTDQTKTIGNVTLYRIRALIDFGGVKAGELGGFIEKEANLSHVGNCWVYDDACVYNGARVFDAAMMFDNAQMFDNAKLFGEGRLNNDVQLCGQAWVSGKVDVSERACISGNTYMYDDIQISADAHITGNDDYITMFPLNSEGMRLTAYKQKNDSVYVIMGLFEGSFEKFMDYLDTLPEDKYSPMLYGIAGVIATKLSNE